MEVTGTEKLIKSQQSSGGKKRGKKCQQEEGAQTVRDNNTEMRAMRKKELETQ